ncbi:MAG: ABC transporter permease [Dehalococcoidia bacterium]
MGRYIATRLLASVPVIVVVVTVAFALLHLAPGDPALLAAGDRASPEQVEETRHALGLNRPLHVQFALWSRRALQGDLGRSVFSHEPVTDLIAQRIQPTVAVGLLALVGGIVIGVPLGGLAAWRRGSWIDRGTMVFATLGYGIPSFWLGYILIYIFTLTLSLLPPAGYEPLSAGVVPFLRSVILPSATIAFGIAGLLARMTRTAMLEVLGQDYVRTARSKGMTEHAVLLRHAAKNAALPVMTVIGISVAYVLAGVAVVETVFAIPGLGRLFVEGALSRDYPVVQGTILITGMLLVTINLLVDLSYGWFDPRIRF